MFNISGIALKQFVKKLRNIQLVQCTMSTINTPKYTTMNAHIPWRV